MLIARIDGWFQVRFRAVRGRRCELVYINDMGSLLEVDGRIPMWSRYWEGITVLESIYRGQSQWHQTERKGGFLNNYSRTGPIITIGRLRITWKHSEFSIGLDTLPVSVNRTERLSELINENTKNGIIKKFITLILINQL